MINYQETYDAFVKRLVDGEQIEPAETGKTIVLMAHAYGQHAQMLPSLERKVNIQMAELMKSADKETGKAMSGTKADAIVKATDDYHTLNATKAALDTIEAYINALKAMVKAQTGEFANAKF